jgi:hypothetical protein
VSAGLITAVVLGLAGLIFSAAIGFVAASSAEVSRHVSLGLFFTLITLLAHSMTMFYLIGKGKAVREAVTEGDLSPELYATVARARKPVFSIATAAMLLTMVTAIIGGGVDTGALPAGIHSMLAVAAIAANVMALRTEVGAMLSSSRVVAEIDALLTGTNPTSHS